MNNLEDDIKTLSMHETFGRFIKSIHNLREDAIGDMQDSAIEKIQQLSGEIIAYDYVLKIADWESLRMRHKDSLQ
jgi:hypothetical protein